MAAHVLLGLSEDASLAEAEAAHRELSLIYGDSGNETMLTAVKDAYAILKERDAARRRGELVAGMAVVEVLASMREVSERLFAGDDDALVFARRRKGMPPWVSEARRHTAVVAPSV